MWTRPTFSPHAWGWSEKTGPQGSCRPVFPTRVGMVRQAACSVASRFSFPHTRGDGPRWRNQARKPRSFSPHAWGWSALGTITPVSGKVFPTRVGMVRRSTPTAGCYGSFPHTRGDGPNGWQNNSTTGKFSPHAWGWSAGPKSACGNRPVFPTRVGMVRLGQKKDRLLAGFPHTRGDGPLFESPA